jgi:hypothetical protein
MKADAHSKEWWQRSRSHAGVRSRIKTVAAHGLSHDSSLDHARVERVRELWCQKQKERMAAQGMTQQRRSLPRRCQSTAPRLQRAPEKLSASNQIWNDLMQANSTGSGVRTQIWMPDGKKMDP